MNIVDRIKKQLSDNSIVLYMKGTPEFPQCGYSGRAVQLLKSCNAKFAAINVLVDADIREGIKRYGDWPTIPQLYIAGELVGGSDILLELYESGELQRLVDEAQAVS